MADDIRPEAKRQIAKAHCTQSKILIAQSLGESHYVIEALHRRMNKHIDAAKAFGAQPESLASFI